MKYLKKFNESKNFEEIYDEEIKFIENSLIDLDDEFDILHTETLPKFWENFQDCIYTKKFMDINDVFCYHIVLRINCDFDDMIYSMGEVPTHLHPVAKIHLEKKYPGILKKVEEIEEKCLNFIRKNDNEVECREDLSTYRDNLQLVLLFRMKRIDWIEKDNSVKFH